MKESEHWISNLIKSLSDLVNEPMPEEVREDLADFVGKLAVDCIQTAGNYYELRCPMDGEYKIGGNWSETH